MAASWSGPQEGQPNTRSQRDVSRPRQAPLGCFPSTLSADNRRPTGYQQLLTHHGVGDGRCEIRLTLESPIQAVTLGQPHTANSRTITVEKNPACPRAVAEMKRDGELWRFSRLRQSKFLNNIVEQDHRRVKRLVRPGIGFGGVRTARRTLAGYEAMAMVRKGQVRGIGGRDMRAQASFVAGLFQVAA
jgi:hypothetical protein